MKNFFKKLKTLVVITSFSLPVILFAQVSQQTVIGSSPTPNQGQITFSQNPSVTSMANDTDGTVITSVSGQISTNLPAGIQMGDIVVKTASGQDSPGNNVLNITGSQLNGFTGPFNNIDMFPDANGNFSGTIGPIPPNSGIIYIFQAVVTTQNNLFYYSDNIGVVFTSIDGVDPSNINQGGGGTGGNDGGGSGQPGGNGTGGGGQPDPNDGGGGGVVTGEITETINNPLNVSDITDFMAKLLEIFIKVAIPILVIFIVYSGFRFLIARGNEAELEKAKKNFLWVVIGTAIVLGSWVIITIIRGTVEQISLIHDIIRTIV